MSYDPNNQDNLPEDPSTPPNSSGYLAGEPGYSPPQFTPKPLGETLRQLPRQYWRIFTHPGAATFAEEQASASWGAVWIQVIVYGIVVAILTFLVEEFVFPTLFVVPSLPNTPDQFQALAILRAFLVFVFALVGTFIGAGIFWLIARAFRGQGRFLQYVYCYLLIYVPLGIIMYLCLLVPLIGSLLMLIPMAYGLVLLILMTAGVHRMSGRKASLAVLILPIVAVIFSCILISVAFPSFVHPAQNVPNTQSAVFANP